MRQTEKKITRNNARLLLSMATLIGMAYPIFANFTISVQTSAAWDQYVPAVTQYVGRDLEVIPAHYIHHDAESDELSIPGTAPTDINKPDPATLAAIKAIIDKLPNDTAKNAGAAESDRNKNDKDRLVILAVNGITVTEKEKYSPCFGDPVFAATGEYAMRGEVDLSFPYGNGSVSLFRSYLSTAQGSRSIGKQWAFSYDMRIISGMNADAQALYESVGEKHRALDDTYHEKLRVITGQNLVKKIISSSTIIAGLDETISELDKYSYSECVSCAADARKIRSTYEKYRNDMISVIASADAMKPYHDSLTSTFESVARERNFALDNQERNKYVLSNGDPSSWHAMGNRTFALIDEYGTAHVYALDAVPDLSSTATYANGRINRYPSGSTATGMLPGNDTVRLTGDGEYVLTRKDGSVVVFSLYGQIRTITDANGNALSFAYRNGKLDTVSDRYGRGFKFTWTSGRISRIQGPSGQTVAYRYDENGYLWGVTDAEGDAVSYEYDEGHLTKIAKNDGSSIQLLYGERRADGRWVVTETRHEEQKKDGSVTGELFYYDVSGRKTKYTNHSGVVTTYEYDENYRTKYEWRSDGSVVSYAYDGATSYLSSMTIRNGSNISTTAYLNDSKGNRTQAAYSDGTTEDWQWNDFCKPLYYKDRDGYCAWYDYDERGNCVAMYRGKSFVNRVLVYSATYRPDGMPETSKSGEQASCLYRYDAYGYLSEKHVMLESGTITELWTNDAIGRVLSHTVGSDADGIGGKTTTWRYFDRKGSANRRVVERTAEGLTREYEYDGRKDLVLVTERENATGIERITRIDYDNRHLPVNITDGSGNITVCAYRADGKILSVSQGSWVTAYGYDPVSGESASVTRSRLDKRGVVVESSTERYPRGATAIGRIRSVSRTNTSNPAMPLKTTYQFDSWDRVVSVENAAGETSVREISGGGRVRREQVSSGGWIGYEYDAVDGRISAVGKESGVKASVIYNLDGTIKSKTDRNGVTTSYLYDGRALVSEELSAGGKKTYAYDAIGRVVRQDVYTLNFTGPGDGHAYATWDYDDTHNAVTFCEGGLYTTEWTMNAWGDAVSKTDGEGNCISWKYNGAGKLSAVTDAYGKETKYAWNAIGKVSSVTYPDGTSEGFVYNQLGQLKSITDSEGVQWEGSYDDAGRLVGERGRPGLDKAYAYDALDRIVEVRSGGDVIERYVYDERGRTVSLIDGNTFSSGGKPYQYKNDEYGQLSTEVNRLASSMKLDYDEEGRLSATTGFSGKLTSVLYDDAAGKTTARYSDGSESIIWCDFSGNVTQAKGDTGTISYEFNAGGRMIQQCDESSGETTHYSYDRAGRRVRMESGNRSVGYAYGKSSELTALSDSKQRLSVSFAYDVRGREILRTYGNGVRQETSLDSIGRTTIIREIAASGALVRAEGYIYDDAGRRTHCVDETGNVTKYEYDNQSRLLVVLYPFTAEKIEIDRIEAECAGLSFVEDAARGESYQLLPSEMKLLAELMNDMSPGRGNMLRVTNLMWQEKFGYDLSGNRVSKTSSWGTVVFGYDAENRLVGKGSTKYEYDHDGNLLSEKGLRKQVSYAYTGNNRMKTSVVTDLSTKTRTVSQYRYDAFGRRTVVRDRGGETMRTLYDGQGFDVIREGVTFGDGSLTTNYANARTAGSSSESEDARYVWIDGRESERTTYIDEDGYGIAASRYTGTKITLSANGQTFAMTRSAGTGQGSSTKGGISYMGDDVLGSVRSSTNEYGCLEELYEYDAFGNPYKGDFAFGMDVGYTGKPYDEITGMYNYGYRDYSPQTARFTTVDPIKDGSNWFAYVNNDPVNFMDEWGLLINPLTSTNQMNSGGWENNPINDVKGKGNTLGKQGCAITLVSNIASNANGKVTTPQDLNSTTSAFIQKGNIDVNWSGAGDNVGLYIERSAQYRTSLINNIVAQIELKEAILSPEQVYVGVQVPITVNGKEASHWVGVDGQPIVSNNGTEYLKVSPTSIHDDSGRTVNPNWKYDDATGDLYVRADSVTGTIVARKQDVQDPLKNR